MVSEVVYLGHKIDEQGLHPLAEKVQAAPAPENVSELKSHLGFLSYYMANSYQIFVQHWFLYTSC